MGVAALKSRYWRWSHGAGRLRGFVASAGDEAVDLAVAEQPAVVLFDHLVEIAAARADLGSVRAVLHDSPVGAHLGLFAVERDRDVGHQMDRTRPVVASARPDVARQPGDCGAAGALAKGSVPGAVLGEQCRHVIVAAAIEPEAILGQHLANGTLVLRRARHRFPPLSSIAAV